MSQVKCLLLIFLSVIFWLGSTATATSSVFVPNHQRYQDFGVSPDEQYLVFMTSSGEQENRLIKVFSKNISSGVTTRIYSSALGETIQFDFTSDSSKILIYGRPDETGSGLTSSSKIVLVPLVGGVPIVLATNNASDSSRFGVRPRLSADNKYLVYASKASSEFILRSVNIDSGAIHVFNSGHPIARGIIVSPDSQYVIYKSGNLYSEPIEGGTAIMLNRALIDDDVTSPNLVSPDSKYVVYMRSVSRFSYEMFSVGIKGGTPTKLSADRASSPRFAPDGRTLIFSRRVGNITGLYSIQVTGGGGEIQLDSVENRYIDGDFSFSPDGQWVVYKTYSIDFEGAPQERILNSVRLNGGPSYELVDERNGLRGSLNDQFLISRDSTKVIYIEDLFNDSLFITPIGAEGESRQLLTSNSIFNMRLSADGFNLFYQGSFNEKEIYKIPIPIGAGSVAPAVKVSDPLGPDDYISQYYLSKDSDFVFYRRETRGFENRLKTKIFINRSISPPLFVSGVRTGNSNADLSNNGNSNNSQPLLRVRFSKPLFNPAGDGLETGDASDPSLYRLIAAGLNGAIESNSTVGCAIGVQNDDIAIPINKASYSTDGMFTRLDVNDSRDLSPGKYVLLVCGSTAPAAITDISGGTLDGDRNGIVGDDYVLKFTIGDSNQLCFPVKSILSKLAMICI